MKSLNPHSLSKGNREEDSLRIRKWNRDKRREGKGSIHSLDGPVLRPKEAKTLPLSASSHLHDESGYLSYARAASTHAAQDQHHSIQTSPAYKHCPPRLSDPNDHGFNALAYRQAPTTLLAHEESFEEQSTAPPSIFDEDEVAVDDEHLQLSDLDTDVSNSTRNGQDELPADIDRQDRLTQPSKYFTDLEDLEASVAGNSGLFLMTQKNRQRYPRGSKFQLRFTFACHSVAPGSSLNFESFDEKILNFCHVQGSKCTPDTRNEMNHTRDDLGYWSFHILECRNMMLSVISNIDRMRRKQYCSSFFSLLALDSGRSDVVKLVSIPIEKLQSLHRTMEDAIRQISSLIDSSRPQRSLRIQHTRQEISTGINEILQPCGLSGGHAEASKWRRALMILDLAIISYCGTHQENFGQTYLQENLDLAKITSAWTYDTLADRSIMLRRRRLRCLDKLLQSPVWVFQDSTRWQEKSELYLSTDIETFSDTWGPVWSVKSESDPTHVEHFVVGLGALQPWLSDPSTPPLYEEEILCHWTASGHVTSNVFNQFPLSFSEKSKLLIGATASTSGTMMDFTTSQLKENPQCTNRTARVMQDLRSTKRIEELGTSSDHRYVAQETLTAQVGYQGFQVGGQKTWKRRTGVTLKDAIIEEWKYDSSTGRNPAVIEHWIGVEISFCSGNARRRRLKDILASRTMNNWLESCKTNPTPFPCEKLFHESLHSPDPRAFRKLYIQHREWRQDLGQLISWCLEGLRNSKIDAEGNLHVLWMPAPEKRVLVKMKEKEHGWAGFLADSRDHCCLPVMSGKCLSSDYKYASRCQMRSPTITDSGYSVLETSLLINGRADRPKSLGLRAPESVSSSKANNSKPRWSISHVQPGDKLPVHAGRLQVLGCFARTRLLCQWERGMARKWFDFKSKEVKERVGVESLCHMELRDEGEEWPTRAVPLFVVSQKESGA